MTDKQIASTITDQVAANFRSFGGGKKSAWGNPIAAAMEDSPPMFAAGVDIREVVDFVIRAYADEFAKEMIRRQANAQNYGD